MGLRKYINDLEFSKKVNYSSMGRRFENSDYIKSIKLTKMEIKNIFLERGLQPKIVALCAAAIFPISNLVVYGKVKNDKKKWKASYDKFYNNPNLILNH